MRWRKSRDLVVKTQQTFSLSAHSEKLNCESRKKHSIKKSSEEAFQFHKIKKKLFPERMKSFQALSLKVIVLAGQSKKMIFQKRIGA